MGLKQIRLELAREKEHPEGDARQGYEFIAPLDGKGRFCPKEWRRARKRCTVRQFRPDAVDLRGLLIHTDSGAWAFSYDPLSDDDDEAVFRLDAHTLMPGEYVSVKEPGGNMHTFRVTKIHSVA
jgi:hypothetical protein